MLDQNKWVHLCSPVPYAEMIRFKPPVLVEPTVSIR